jgi:transcriptional antiterminator RfaH
MTNFISGWYVLYTRPRSEKKVSDRLVDSGIEFYLPLFRSLRTWNKHKKLIDMPLFPSYVFVYLKELKDYYGALDNEGVLRFVRFGKDLARVGTLIIDNIRRVIEKGSDIEVSFDYFQPGQAVSIEEGSLSGLSGEVVMHNKINKILVRINLLNRNILITVPASHLSPIAI